MTFEQAFKAVQSGSRISRKAWKECGFYMVQINGRYFVMCGDAPISEVKHPEYYADIEGWYVIE